MHDIYYMFCLEGKSTVIWQAQSWLFENKSIAKSAGNQ